MKILINNTASDISINDVGIAIIASSNYTIPPQDYLLWAASEDVVDNIVSGDLTVSDGDLTLGKRIGIALIQDNTIVLNEYYTLVEDDSILIGNGQTLYLNDRFDTTSNVPDYLDDDIEDDIPTEG